MTSVGVFDEQMFELQKMSLGNIIEQNRRNNLKYSNLIKPNDSLFIRLVVIAFGDVVFFIFPLALFTHGRRTMLKSEYNTNHFRSIYVIQVYYSYAL